MNGFSRAQSEPALCVARAKALLAVAAGQPFTDAARAAGRKSGDAVAHLVAHFNRAGLAALRARTWRRSAEAVYRAEQERILREVRREPDRDADGTGTWSLTTLQRALRQAPDGLPTVSTATIWARAARCGLRLAAGSQLVRDGRRRPQAEEREGDGGRSRCHGEKNLIEAAYAQERLPVWTEDEAGPYPTHPYPGVHWQPTSMPVRHPHEYVRAGTSKQLTLFHPASGTVRVKGVRSCTNAVLHPWLEAELHTILATLPEPTETLSAAENRRCWARWQEGLSVRITLPEHLPPLRLLLVLDNLTGHLTPSFVLWLFAHGIMPLYTPLGGSWLNMPAESIQRILKRRALDGHHPQTPAGDHRVAGEDRCGVESGTDAVCLGREAASATGAGAARPPRARWVRCLY